MSYPSPMKIEFGKKQSIEPIFSDFEKAKILEESWNKEKYLQVNASGKWI